LWLELELTPVVRVCGQDQRDESTETNSKRVHVKQDCIKVEPRARPFDDAVIHARSASAVVANHESRNLHLVGDISAKHREGQRNQKLGVDVRVQRGVALPPSHGRESHD